MYEECRHFGLQENCHICWIRDKNHSMTNLKYNNVLLKNILTLFILLLHSKTFKNNNFHRIRR